MKTKFILALLVTAIHFSSYSQEFMGIKADGPIADCIAKFVAKGFTKKEVKGHIATLKGMVGTEEVELYIVASPKSKIVWKFAVYFPEQTSWYSIKSQYDRMKETLIKKYGEPSNDYHFFSSPYYEGDGYETTAVSVEKCTYSAFWTQDNPIELSISKYMQVYMTYENTKNLEIKKKETDEINNQNF